MAQFRDRTGEKLGRLTILCEATKNPKTGRVRWHCRCDCGEEFIANGSDLYGNRTTSCGCLQRERTAAANARRIRHGHARDNGLGGRATSPEYRSWKAMKERCRNVNAPNYHLYGGRGISVCERWLEKDGFNNFLADLGERPDGATLDRINNDGNYEPGNVRWATPKEQSNNRRDTPEYRAIRIASLDRGRERMWSDPEIRERLIESRRKK